MNDKVRFFAWRRGKQAGDLQPLQGARRPAVRGVRGFRLHRCTRPTSLSCALTQLVTLTRAQGFPKLCVTADPRLRPRLDQLTLIKIAPASLPLRLCNMVRVYELRGHPATESPSAETRQRAALTPFRYPHARAREDCQASVRAELWGSLLTGWVAQNWQGGYVRRLARMHAREIHLNLHFRPWRRRSYI